MMQVPREEVERCNIEPPLQALRAMASTPETTREYGGRVVFVFDGYQSDPRELYSIAEVRRFVRALTNAFPYWLHFSSKVDDSLMVLVQCLVPVGPVTIVDGVATTALDTAAWNKTLMELFGCMNGLYAQHALSEAENSTVTRQVQEYFRTFFKE